MLTGFYPVLMTDDVATTAAFYRSYLQFETVFEADWYVSLRRDPHFELAILDRNHETIPDQARALAGGMLLNLEVDDVDAEYRRLVIDGGIVPLLDIKSEAFGQRHFIIAAPDGVAIDVITPIEPSPEFAANYLSE
ncbi:MAG: VOC family protein [Thermomicrobiales bacterium]